MRLDGLTHHGTVLDDPAILHRVPPNLAKFLRQRNGLVALRGAVHFRGACLAPAWHSLRCVMEGPLDLRASFGELEPTDVPFAEDCMGNQFVLRGREVHRLDFRSGALASLNGGLKDFFLELAERPESLVDLGPLRSFESAGGFLRPGRSLQACSTGSSLSLRSVPTLELLKARGLAP